MLVIVTVCSSGAFVYPSVAEPKSRVALGHRCALRLDSDGKRCRGDDDAQFLAVGAGNVGSRYGELESTRRRRRAEDFARAFIQVQAVRQVAVGDAPGRGGALGCKLLAVGLAFSVAWQRVRGCDGGRMVDGAVSTDVVRQRARVVDGAVVSESAAVSHGTFIG